MVFQGADLKNSQSGDILNDNIFTHSQINLMEKREIRITTSWETKDRIQTELDNILIKDLEWENKVRLESKEDMKKRLGHSPDYADAIMMRMYRELNRVSSPIEKTEIITINFDDMLY